MTRAADDNAAAFAATFCAAVMLGHQVAAKAARDALFLSSYDVADLPKIVIAASIASMLVAFGTARAMHAYTPHRIVPGAFLVSGALLAAQWGLATQAPRAAAITVYLHTVIFGAVLASGFWSLVNERFDPRAAKRLIGRIASGGTIGGLFGAVAAERVGASLSIAAILPILAGAHALCAYLTRELSGALAGVPAAAADAPSAPEAAESGASNGYLWNLAALVGATTIAAALLDYVLKSKAAAALPSGEALMRFFAVFHAGVGLVSFGVQATLTRRLLEKWGLAIAVAALPSAALLGSLGVLLLPKLGTVIAARSVEGVVRASLYRSGYELLYLPLPAGRKRSAKAIIDVAVDRLGDAVGGGFITIVLALAATSADLVLVATALGLSAAALGAALVLRRGYVRALEHGLVSRAVALEGDALGDALTTGTMRLTLEVPSPPLERPLTSTPAEPQPAIELDDEVVHIVAGLRSGDVTRVRAAVAAAAATEPAVLAHVIPLLAFDEVRDDVERLLEQRLERTGGLLADVLLDPDEDFVVRRRIPELLGGWRNARAVLALLSGLEDKRFEVRYQCGRALQRLTREAPDLRVDEAHIYAAVRRAVTVDKAVWESQRLLDPARDDGAFVDELLRERASRSMEHVFTLLSLVLTPEPLQVAFRGLYTDDPVLRGIALEYLETVLPPDIKEGLWPFLEESSTARAQPGERDRALEELMRSRQSIQLNLEAARRR